MWEGRHKQASTQGKGEGSKRGLPHSQPPAQWRTRSTKCGGVLPTLARTQSVKEGTGMKK